MQDEFAPTRWLRGLEGRRQSHADVEWYEKAIATAPGSVMTLGGRLSEREL